MDYKKHYSLLVEKVIHRGRFDGYKEKHHIIPICMGGDNSKENLVYLTAREHYISHWLLHKMYPNNDKLMFALHRIMYGRQKKYLKLSSKQYEKIRISVSKSRTGKGNYMYGRKHTKENRNKISLAQIGKSRNWLYKVVDPNGKIISNYENKSLVSICKENTLSFSSIIKCFYSNKNEYKGWYLDRKKPKSPLGYKY